MKRFIRSRRQVLALGAAATFCATGPAWAAPAPEASKEPQDFLKTPPKPCTIKGDFKLISIGDLLYSHPEATNPDPELQKVFRLIKSGDVTIGNREGVCFDLPHFTGYGDDGGLLWGDPTIAKDMKAMGVDMVSVANNHSLDWGPQGLLESMRLLKEAGLAYAGGGRNLQEARAPGYFQTPKGRVALVSTTASMNQPGFGANDPTEEDGEPIPARPGVSILRTRTITLVTPQEMAEVRGLATALASPLKPPPKADARDVHFGGETYRVSNQRGLIYEMDLYDHAGLLKAVREAKDHADLVVFTIHAHQSTTGDDDDNPPPPNFLIELFHNCVDAGADVIMGGGPHSLRGVEIYKGRPILYGMGAFFIKGAIASLQESQQHVFPDATGHAPPPKPPERSVRAGGNPASWYDGVVAITEYENARPKTVRLYPLDTGNTYEQARRGVPHLADPTYGHRILVELQQDSAQFGTQIEIQDGVGIIHIA